jgi:hypothetical protein
MINEHDITKLMLNKIRSYTLIKEADELGQNTENQMNGERVNISIDNIIFSGKLKDIEVDFTMNYNKQLGLIINTANLKLDDGNQTIQELSKLNIFYKQWIESWVQRLEDNKEFGDKQIVIIKDGTLNSSLDEFTKQYWEEDEKKIKQVVSNSIEFNNYIINP